MKKSRPSDQLLEQFNKWFLAKNHRTYNKYKKLHKLPWSNQQFAFYYFQYFKKEMQGSRKNKELSEHYESIKERQVKKQGFRTVYKNQEFDPARIMGIILGRIKVAQ